MDLAHQGFDGRWRKVVLEVCNQRYVVVVAKLHFERATFDRVPAIPDSGSRGMLPGNLQDRGPVHRVNGGLRVVPGDRDSEHPMAGGQIEHLERLSFVCLYNRGDCLGRGNHQGNHAASKFLPNGMFVGDCAATSHHGATLPDYRSKILKELAHRWRQQKLGSASNVHARILVEEHGCVRSESVFIVLLGEELIDHEKITEDSYAFQ